jgi:hypothetical protein
MFQGALRPTELGSNVAWFQASHVSIELGTNLYWNMGVMIQNRQRVDQGRGMKAGRLSETSVSEVADDALNRGQAGREKPPIDLGKLVPW